MAVPLTSFIEQSDSVSNSTAKFSLQGATSRCPLYLFGSSYPSGRVTLTDVPDAVDTILGNVGMTPGDGRLSRSLPVAHPLYNWLFAVNVDVRGFGQGYEWQAGQLFDLEVTPLPNFTGYPNYEFDVEFGPRNYVVAANASVPLLPISFYDTDGDLQDQYKAAAEWVRYTDWWYERKFESITARQGFMKFRSTIDTGPPSVKDVPYADMPRLFLPDSLLKIVWSQIPYRYITSPNSYIDGLIGLINQNAFTIWQPGELLYVGYTAHRYTPPVQGFDQIYTGTSGYIYSAEKWCDVELLFLRTKRKIASPGEMLADTGNPNWIQAGWNLLPWLQDRGFHYATSVGPTPDTTLSKWRPMFQSTEFALLFTDPDADGGFQVANL